MEKPNQHEQPSHIQDDIEIMDGKRYRKIPSGYTLRQYYSHAGPGWDTRWPILTKYGVNEPEDLPDEQHFNLELVEN